MGLGKFFLDQFGLKNKYQPLFEKFVRLGLLGMGYEQPMKSTLLEDITLQRSLKKTNNPVIFDIGANRGDYVNSIIQLIGEQNPTIYAFEPDQKNADLIRKNYGTFKGLHIIQKGLGNQNNWLKFYHHSQSDLSSLYYSNDHPSDYRSKELEEVTEVEIITLDDFCASNKIEMIHFLKIDTEGHDYFVLQGAKEMIAKRKIKHIQFEFSDMNIMSKTSFFDFWKLLREDYTIFRICKDKNFPISQYSPLLHEIYYPVNFLASLKN